MRAGAGQRIRNCGRKLISPTTGRCKPRESHKGLQRRLSANDRTGEGPAGNCWPHVVTAHRACARLLPRGLERAAALGADRCDGRARPPLRRDLQTVPQGLDGDMCADRLKRPRSPRQNAHFHISLMPVTATSSTRATGQNRKRGEDGKDESSKEVADRHIDKRDEDHV